MRMLASVRLALIALFVGSLGAGCNTTWRSKSVQPTLTLGHGDMARTSLTNEILVRDMELSRRVFLANSAYFVAVSKDRLRFHVRLVHKWKSIADPARWRVWIEDDHGNKFYPEGIDGRYLTRATEFEIVPHNYYVIAFKIGGLSRTNSNPIWRLSEVGCPRDVIVCQVQRLPPEVTVWRGDGDYTFYRRDIFAATSRQLTLVMSRFGYTYRYSWKFVPDPELAGFEERHASLVPAR